MVFKSDKRNLGFFLHLSTALPVTEIYGIQNAPQEGAQTSGYSQHYIWAEQSKYYSESFSFSPPRSFALLSNARDFNSQTTTSLSNIQFLPGFRPQSRFHPKSLTQVSQVKEYLKEITFNHALIGCGNSSASIEDLTSSWQESGPQFLIHPRCQLGSKSLGGVFAWNSLTSSASSD